MQREVTMAAIWKRPVDLFFVLSFAAFALIAATIDIVQSTYGSVLELEELEYGAWPPRVVVDMYFWWCQTYDTLLGHNPVWFESLAIVSPTVYLPFYLFAIYAFIYQREWIRIPALMWAWGTFLTLLPCIREQLEGPYKTKDVPVVLVAYGAYVAVPIFLIIRMAFSPVFGSGKEKLP